LDGLAPGATYYCKAKAAGDDIGYGAEMSFTTAVDSGTPAPQDPGVNVDDGTAPGGSDVICVPGDAGDANGDGMINAADVTVAERIIAGLQEPNAGADVNGDGIVDAADIEGILLACCGVVSR
jgi:hypothetical protein